MVKKNGGPDLKRARRTSLSTRRARRTNPPRLLVKSYSKCESFAKCVCHQMLLLLLLLLLHLFTEEEGRSGEEE